MCWLITSTKRGNQIIEYCIRFSDAASDVTGEMSDAGISCSPVIGSQAGHPSAMCSSHHNLLVNIGQFAADMNDTQVVRYWCVIGCLESLVASGTQARQADKVQTLLARAVNGS